MFYEDLKFYCKCKGQLIWDYINDNYFCEECNKQYISDEIENDEQEV